MKKDRSGYIIAAAFIGPGTITTASMAGANYGFHLVWALVFSIFATAILQDMAARLGSATGAGLATGLNHYLHARWAKILVAGLIVSAIGVGNAAYESGNLTGAAIGLNTFIAIGTSEWAVLLGIIAAALLWSGKYRVIETVLITLVLVMGAVFLLTLLVARPDIAAMVEQLFQPRLDSSSITTILALIGTTIVPYNLFLHASLVAKNTQQQTVANAIRESRSQSAKAISMGGLITLVVVATAMMAFYRQGITLDASTMGSQLAPVLGDQAQWLFAVGLFAAGLTSAITAPLAAAYAVCGALNLPDKMDGRAFRTVWLSIIVVGVGIASWGFKPLAAILFAQATNALLLPLVALFLLVVMNTHPQLGRFKNGVTSNILGIAVTVLVTGLGCYKLFSLY